MNQRFTNPYVIGTLLGLVMLFSFYTMGRVLDLRQPLPGLQRQGLIWWLPNMQRPTHISQSTCQGVDLLLCPGWFFLTMGAALGGLFSAFIANRIKGEVARGPSIGVSARLWLALGGGILSGFAARLARGCTSGQALTGAAELAFGSWIFMFSIFAGAYATAYFLERSGYNGTSIQIRLV